MTIDELRTEVGRYTFMPGWRFEVITEFPCTAWAAAAIQCRAEVPDVNDPTSTVQITRAHVVPLGFPASVVKELMRDLVIDAMIHECDEWLKRDGVAPFDPHRSERT